jgi:hypothetical protein
MTAKVSETAAQNGVPKWRKQPKRQTKALVVEALNTLFNKRDFKTAERSWSSNHIQHSVAAHRQLYLPNSGSVCRRRVK